MFYVALAFTTLWLCNFAYIFFLDRQLKDIGKRLAARDQSTD